MVNPGLGESRSHRRPSQHGTLRLQRWSAKLPLFAVLILLAVMFGIPFFWAISSSFKTYRELWLWPPRWLPMQIQWRNYLEIWTVAPLAMFLRNSFIITFASVAGMLLSSSLVGYGFARFNFPGKNKLFLILLGTMILPGQVTLIPSFLLYKALGWLDSYKPLYLPFFFGASAFATFLFRQFFMTIPREFDDAAKVDGANFLTIYAVVLMPLARPVTITLAILQFLHSWNELLWPVVVLNTYEKFPLALGLQYFRTQAFSGGVPREHLMMAAAMVMTLPCLLLYVFAQRYFTQGIMMSGLKA